MSLSVCKMTGCCHGQTWRATSASIKTIRGHIDIDLSRHIINLLRRWLQEIVLLLRWCTMSVQLCMLDSARLHIQLLVVYLLHLISIRLFDEGFDSVKFAWATCRNAHIIRINTACQVMLIVLLLEHLLLCVLCWRWRTYADARLSLLVNAHAMLVVQLLLQVGWLSRGSHIVVLVHASTSVVGWLLVLGGVPRLLLVMMGALCGDFLAQNFRKHFY